MKREEDIGAGREKGGGGACDEACEKREEHEQRKENGSVEPASASPSRA
jgi:hypothetical protein